LVSSIAFALLVSFVILVVAELGGLEVTARNGALEAARAALVVDEAVAPALVISFL
jgi:hypothetical protein